MASYDRGLARPTSRLMNKKARTEIARDYKEVKDSSRISIIDRIYAEVLGKGIIDEKKTATAFESKDLIDLVTEDFTTSGVFLAKLPSFSIVKEAEKASS